MTNKSYTVGFMAEMQVFPLSLSLIHTKRSCIIHNLKWALPTAWTESQATKMIPKYLNSWTGEQYFPLVLSEQVIHLVALNIISDLMGTGRGCS